MRKFVAVILIITILFLICRCGNVSSDANEVEKHFIKAVNNFSYDTAKVLLKDRTDNFNYSPVSLYYALAVVGSGASGKTQQQIFHLLNVSSEKKLSAQCEELYKVLYSDNKISKLKIANSLWLNENKKFNDTFVSNAENYFHMSTFSVDFSYEDTKKAMAEWISENTNGTLTPNLELNPKQTLSIINTIYFCDEWVNEFNKKSTQKEAFHGEKGDAKADFMHKSDTMNFVIGENYMRSSLDLKGGAQMVFILPDEGVTVSDLLSCQHSMKALFEDGNVHFGRVKWAIPKFDFYTQCSLKEVLNTMGVTDVFEEKADLSGITKEKTSISQVLQQTKISIDENGVEASAFTQIDMYGVVCPDESAEMILNRPFIYGITSSDGTLIFMGVCNNPSV
ncbi:serpin family protein [Anaerovorax odorimutans]|uniref:serpin family protein n=1 Tax=Anaerovorax odorimutans TaxID=109327 RepID=UPI0004003D64|nr:serpin family protein [Anaerovorax odorimutans]